MLKHIALILLTQISCIQTNETSQPATESGIEINYGEGVVSEDPPGADDWNTGTDSDTVDTNSNEMTASYDGCSNEIAMWSEPDPLTKPCNFQLADQNGDLVELYDFEGDVIMLDFSTMWCRVCKNVAEHVQEMNDQYTPFSIITVLTQDSSGNPPTVDQLQDWADEYSITTAPVLAGSDMMSGTDPEEWNVVAVPTFFFVDKDFHLRILMAGWNETTATGHIEALLAE